MLVSASIHFFSASSAPLRLPCVSSIRRQDSFGLPRDDQFFVRRDDPDLRAALDPADLLFPASHVVLLRVQADAGPLKVLTDGGADRDAVLADAAGEGEHVAAAKHDQVLPDVPAAGLDEG